MAFETILLVLFVLLVAAKAAGELAERIGQPPVLGELLAGVLLGPTAAGFLDLSAPDAATEAATLVAELGVILLLFEVGLETRLKDLIRVGRSAVLVATLGIAGAFVAGFAASLALAKAGVWTDSLLFHVFVGATLTATSVGITARVLSDMGRLATPEARTILGAAVLDDVGGLLVLTVMVALSRGAVEPLALATQAAVSLGFLVVAIAVGVRIMPPVVDLLMRLRVRGILVTSAVAFALVMAYLAEIAGLAGIVGAFAAGLILAKTRQQPAMVDRVRPLADLFTPFFFVFVGLHVDLRGIGADGVRILVVALVLGLAAVVGKLVSGFGVRERGVSRYAVGVGMVPRGEVGLVFALFGLGSIIAEAWEFTAILVVVALTTFVAPIWLKRVLGSKPVKH